MGFFARLEQKLRVGTGELFKFFFASPPANLNVEKQRAILRDRDAAREAELAKYVNESSDNWLVYTGKILGKSLVQQGERNADLVRFQVYKQLAPEHEFRNDVVLGSGTYLLSRVTRGTRFESAGLSFTVVAVNVVFGDKISALVSFEPSGLIVPAIISADDAGNLRVEVPPMWYRDP